MNTGKLAGKTILITGASRGIGKAIALKAAKDGANIVIAAKTVTPHPKLPGTIYTAADEVEKAGGKCLPCILDVRNEDQVKSVVKEAVAKFGGLDILINNASAISLTSTPQTEMKRYDLMHNVNTRGTFLMSKECYPYLKKSANPHIVNISPPLVMQKHWFSRHVAYTMAKYGMSMCVLGMAEEFRDDRIAVNAVWPKTAIDTAAMSMLGGDGVASVCRKPDIMADAVYNLICQQSTDLTGNFLIDEEILKKAGVSDFTNYAVDPSNADNLMPDFFLELPESQVAEMYKKESEKSQAAINKNAPVAQGAGKKHDEISAIFARINSILGSSSSSANDIVQETQAVFVFELTDPEAGSKPASKWHIDLKSESSSNRCGQGECELPADATFQIKNEHFFELFAGNLKPTAAFMSGKLKINGDLRKAMKLEKIMKSFKSKL